MDFYNIGGIVVTDTAFIASNGDQYPIRNITSVQVREDNKMFWLYMSMFWYFIGLVRLLIDLSLVNSLSFFLMGTLLLIYWYFSREYILWLGSGGVKQKSISFKKRNKKDLATLNDIADAINKSIANLQK